MAEEEYLRKKSLDEIQNSLNLEYSKYLKMLLEDKNFKNLNNIINTFNPFRILKLENYEIRHSNFLAWLFNTNGSHKLNNIFFKAILNELGYDKIIRDDTQVEVLREHENIDILIKADNNFICAIENKVWSGEHDDQLKKYENYINNEYSDKEYKKLFIYLTRTGAMASNKIYKSLSYVQIREILDKLLNEKQNIEEPVKNFIKYYIDILDNDLMLKPSDEINNLCEIISQKHYKILEFLYNNDKNYINNVQISNSLFNNLYKKGINAINMILNNQNKLKEDRDKKIKIILEQCFNKNYIKMHSNWAYKLNLENQPYPFKQVDYTTLPFENIMVRFYCGISAQKSKNLIYKIKNDRTNFIKNLKKLKENGFNIKVGYRINNGSGYGIIEDFLTEDFKQFNNVLFSFDKIKPGVIKKDNIDEIMRLPIISEKKLNINENAKQIIFLPVIYIMKEINENIDQCEKIKKQFLEITKNVFEIFQLENSFDELKLN